MVKAQIHVGGRGKGGGVKVAHSLTVEREHAEKILDMKLVTHRKSGQHHNMFFAFRHLSCSKSKFALAFDSQNKFQC